MKEFDDLMTTVFDFERPDENWVSSDTELPHVFIMGPFCGFKKTSLLAEGM